VRQFGVATWGNFFRSYRRLFLILSVAVAIPALAQCGATVQGGTSGKWVDYTATDGSFVVQHPSNLAPSVKKEAASGAIFVVFQAGHSAAAGAASFVLDINYVPTSMGLGVVEGPAQGGSAAMWADLIRSHASKSRGYGEISYKPTSLLGHVAVDYSFTSEQSTDQGSVTLRNRIVVLIAGGKVFMLTGFAVPEEWEASTAARFIASFRTTVG